MNRAYSSMLLLAAALLAAAGVAGQDAGAAGWRRGRATYFGATREWATAYDPTRGEGSFGVLEFGALAGRRAWPPAAGRRPLPLSSIAAAAAHTDQPRGYTNRVPGDQAASLPFPRDQVAAAADGNPDYAGSCGRCYLVRCVNDLVLRNDGSPIQLLPSSDNRTLLQYDGDPMRPYLPSIRRDVPDSRGRRFPGATRLGSGGCIGRRRLRRRLPPSSP